jgi:hypothetical protein
MATITDIAAFGYLYTPDLDAFQKRLAEHMVAELHE